MPLSDQSVGGYFTVGAGTPWRLGTSSLDFTMHDNDESIALLQDSPSVDGEKESPLQAGPSKTSSGASPRWVTIFLFALAAIDVAASLYVVRLLLYDSPRALEVRNQYVGLDVLYKSGKVNSSRHMPIVNMPHLASQVCSAAPHKVYPEDEHRHLTNFGTLSPPDRHLHVSQDTRTILQFRVMDFGMERCSLALRLPEEDGMSSASIINGTGTRLEVCALNAPLPLDARTLSWDTRPRCVGTAGTFDARPGVFTRLPEFPCSWSSYLTYQVSCARDSPGCDVDVWSRKGEPYGIYMYQFQTV